eukprot:11384175-Ditylum_brightwellii.AAC.2
MRTPYNPTAPIKEMLKQIDKANDLAQDANNPYQDRQLWYSTMHVGHGRISPMQELGYAPANFSSIGPPQFATTAAEALQVLAEATMEDCTAVANLLSTNSILNNQVANLTRTILAKESEIKELRKSISKLSTTILLLAPGDKCGGCEGRGGRNNGQGGRGRRGNKPRKEQEQLNIHYCCSHGVTKGPKHTSTNCQNTKDGHQHEVNLFNWMCGSMDDIGS